MPNIGRDYLNMDLVTSPVPQIGLQVPPVPFRQRALTELRNIGIDALHGMFGGIVGGSAFALIGSISTVKYTKDEGFKTALTADDVISLTAFFAVTIGIAAAATTVGLGFIGRRIARL